MAQDVVYRLVVDDSGSIRRIEEFRKEGEKTDKALEKTKRSAKETEKSIKGLGGAFGGLKSMVGMGLGALGVGGVAFGLDSIVNKTSEITEETERFRSASGMGAQSSLYYVAALKARGASTEAVTRGYISLAKNVQAAERQEYSHAIGQAKASAKGRIYTTLLGTQAIAFRKLGVSIAGFKKLKPESQFQLLTEKLERLPAGLEKSWIASQLFGRGAKELLPLLERGPLSLNHFKQKAEELYPALKGGSKELEKWKAAQGEAKMAWEGFQVTLGKELVPALTPLMTGFAHLLLNIERGKGAWGTLEHDAKTAGEDLKEVYTWVTHSKVAMDALGGTLGFLGAAWGVEKELSFYRAIKSLTLITTLAKGFRTMAVAVGLLPEAEGAAAASTGILGAALDTIMPELAALAAAFAAYEAIKKLTEGSKTVYSYGADPKRAKHGNEAIAMFREQHPARVQEEIGAFTRRHLPVPKGLEPYVHHHHHHTIVHHVTKVYLDGREFAQALSFNESAMRPLAEGIERHGLKRAAKG